MPVSQADAQYVRDIVRRRSAISLDDSKNYLIDTRLSELVTRRGFGSVSELVARARNGEVTLHTEIVEAITTHETSFFRDRRPFELLETEVMPDLMKARASHRTLTIWSAACSSGQEPYSIAISLLEKFPQLAGWKVRIIATDISDQVLAKAREGSFSQLEVNRGLPVGLLLKYFERVGIRYRVRDQVKQMVEFKQANLLDAAALGIRPDIVFLRNVLIYFDVDIKRQILDAIRARIAPDGVLFMGSAETTTNVASGWAATVRNDSTYFKVQP